MATAIRSVKGRGCQHPPWTRGANLAHIFEVRQRKDGMNEAQVMHLLDRIVTAIAKGEEVRRHAFQQSENLVVAHEGVEATLTRNRGSNAWLLSGWEIRKPSLADGAGYVASAATSAKPTTAQLHRGEGTPSIDQETTESNSPSFSRKAGDAQQQFKDTERAYGGKAAYEQAKGSR